MIYIYERQYFTGPDTSVASAAGTSDRHSRSLSWSFFSVSIQLQGTKVASNGGEGRKVAGMVMIITYSVDIVIDSIYLYMYI